jgi:hypothetical protein
VRCIIRNLSSSPDDGESVPLVPSAPRLRYASRGTSYAGSSPSPGPPPSGQPTDGGSGHAGSGAMHAAGWAARGGDLAEVQRLVRQDARLLNARDAFLRTPLMEASYEGHMEVVRWLVDQGAALNDPAHE